MQLRKIQYWSNYTIVRWQLLLCAAAVLVGFWYIKKNYGQDVDSDLWKNILVLLGVITWAVFVLFCSAMTTAFAYWIYFLVKIKYKQVEMQVQLGEGEKAEAGYVPVTVTVYGISDPWLLSLRARLVFEKMKFSESILLNQNVRRKKRIFPIAIKGTGKTMLHDRGIYDLMEVQIQVCDFFRLVAWPVTIPFEHQLYTLPKEQKELEVKASPNTTEEQTQRIEIPKRVEGEYINYKDFETGDDVRRIVWKIYARSGQLVVRIPETMDPYASHLYFYASFYNGMSESMNGIFETELLNGYKDKVRSLFEALQKNGFDVRIPLDQQEQRLQGMSDKKNDLFHVASANWQKDKTPTTFVQSAKAAFVCMSSLTPMDEVGQLLGNLPLNVPVVVVRMSDAIESPLQFKLKNIFFKPEKIEGSNLRSPWLISPLHSRLEENERKILRMFQQRGNAWVISVNDK